MALVQCPNCKTQVTSVAARCFSCGQPMPRQFVAAPPKQRKGIAVAYVAGAAILFAGFAMHTWEWIGDGAEEAFIGIGLLVFVGSIGARVFMRWMDREEQPPSH